MSGQTGVLGPRAVMWVDEKLRLIDQRVLPEKLEFIDCTTPQETFDAIRNMTVRGAPAIGVAGAFGMVLALKNSSLNSKKEIIDLLTETKSFLDSARPTAVNLMWGTKRILDILKQQDTEERKEFYTCAIKEAIQIAEDDVQINQSMSDNGYTLFEGIEGPLNVIHHCNTGALATVDIGTALGVIYGIHKHHRDLHVFVDETRPRLQGAKLTAWELKQAGIPFHLMVDGASGLCMRTHKINAVLFGADRVAANGDVCNKIGTYNLAVVAHENHVPVYACVPMSTIDCHIQKGEDICIEERNKEEVTEINGASFTPKDINVYNPAFDVTPNQYITAIITEKRVLFPPFKESIAKLFKDFE
ncbi:hypothetical protein WA158_006338 [Blastocystis sp. Blastoise]